MWCHLTLCHHWGLLCYCFRRRRKFILSLWYGAIWHYIITEISSSTASAMEKNYTFFMIWYNLTLYHYWDLSAIASVVEKNYTLFVMLYNLTLYHHWNLLFYCFRIWRKFILFSWCGIIWLCTYHHWDLFGYCFRNGENLYSLRDVV